ncbi:hypothetical protein HDV00_008491 [Rhizophlyctis rosea]|nr:hypothetical protein HDV00_008491 [Rhizophlyctis rosea]
MSGLLSDASTGQSLRFEVPRAGSTADFAAILKTISQFQQKVDDLQQTVNDSTNSVIQVVQDSAQQSQQQFQDLTTNTVQQLEQHIDTSAGDVVQQVQQHMDDATTAMNQGFEQGMTETTQQIQQTIQDTNTANNPSHQQLIENSTQVINEMAQFRQQFTAFLSSAPPNAAGPSNPPTPNPQPAVPKKAVNLPKNLKSQKKIMRKDAIIAIAEVLASRGELRDGDGKPLTDAEVEDLTYLPAQQSREIRKELDAISAKKWFEGKEEYRKVERLFRQKLVIAHVRRTAKTLGVIIKWK